MVNKSLVVKMGKCYCAGCGKVVADDRLCRPCHKLRQRRIAANCAKGGGQEVPWTRETKTTLRTVMNAVVKTLEEKAMG